MPKPDWLWLAVGLAVGMVLHLSFTHSSSPLKGAFSFYYGANKQ